MTQTTNVNIKANDWVNCTPLQANDADNPIKVFELIKTKQDGNNIRYEDIVGFQITGASAANPTVVNFKLPADPDNARSESYDQSVFISDILFSEFIYVSTNGATKITCYFNNRYV